MHFFIISIILLAVSIWTSIKMMRQDQKEVVYFLFPAITVFIVYMLIEHMRLFHGLELYGTARIVGYMICNCFLPLGYLCSCQLCHIRKNTVTTKCLFAFILLNVFSTVNIYTDQTPVEQFVEQEMINIYRNGKFVFSITIFEFVEVLQLLWILERIGRFSYKMKRDNLQLTEMARRTIRVIFACIVATIIYHILPEQFWDNIGIGYFSQTIAFTLIIALVFMFGWGNHLLFITDKNNEVVFFNDMPNPRKMKRRLEKLISIEKIHRNEGLTIGGVAHLLDTNSTYLVEVLQREFCMTFTAFITEARVKDAMRMIKHHPDMPLSDVAKACGFNSAANFSKAFRKITGTTAKEWSEKK